MSSTPFSSFPTLPSTWSLKSKFSSKMALARVLILVLLKMAIGMPEFFSSNQRILHKPSEGQVRLVIGSQISKYEGNVQFYHAGSWGSVCDDEWDQAEADVICRQLGTPGNMNSRSHNKVTRQSNYGPALDTIWIDEVVCKGNEESLSKCHFNKFGQHDCSKSEAAGVKCSTKEEFLFSEPKVISSVVKEGLNLRLIGGRTIREGRVEIEHPTGYWSYICADGWGLAEANVVCSHLGLGHAHSALQVQLVGNEVSTIILYGVKCHGSEASVDDCTHEKFGIGRGNCPGMYNNVAGVECSIDLPDLVLDVHRLQSSLLIENTPLSGLQCAKEENCLSSSAYATQANLFFFSLRRTLLRFTAAIFNNGTADFRPTLSKNNWIWHLCHRHYHSMEIFAHYDLVDPKSGARKAEGHKASFCLEDNECNPGYTKRYRCENNGDQGISVGCVDVYESDIDCQWLDITGLPSGNYILKILINSEYKVAELTFANNAASCYIAYDRLRESIQILESCVLHTA